MLIGVFAYDRPRLLRASLDALKDSNLERHDVVVHIDSSDHAIEKAVWDHKPERATVVHTPRRSGMALATNLLLQRRAPGQHFCQFATDVSVLSERWADDLEEFVADWAACSPVWPTGRPDRSDPEKLGVEQAWRTVVPCAGVNVINATWLDRLGAWRSYGSYGREDLDYFWRIYYAGGKVSYCPDVKVVNMDCDWLTPTPANKRKREAVEKTKNEWRAQRDRYEQGLDLYQPFAWEKSA